VGANTISVASGSTLDFVTFGSLVPSHGLWAMTRSRTAARKNAGDNAVHNANRARFELLVSRFTKLMPLYTNVTAAAEKAFAGWIRDATSIPARSSRNDQFAHRNSEK
jgi:hypothetical protein